MSTEVVPVVETPGEEWRALILAPDVLPKTLGTEFTVVLEKAQAAWEVMDNPPTSSVVSALFELAGNKEIEINRRIIRRGPNAPQ
jgi:hypothetical protein